MKKILLLDGNPKRNSLSNSLSNAYKLEAERAAHIQFFQLSEMDFNPSLESGYDSKQPLEPCLSEFTEALLWADHIVIVSPIWWGGLPSKLKGLIDRVFLPGTTFKFEQGNPHPIPLLKGKTSRIILTMDAPDEFKEEQAKPILEQLGRFSLEFCGVSPAEVNLFGSVIASDENQKSQWIELVKGLGSDCV